MPKLKTKAALPWFGSDASVAEDIAALINHCKHVTIPFVGGASIVPHLTATGIIANDKHDAAINFYRQLSGEHATKIIDACNRLLSHPTELETSFAVLNDAAHRGSWQHAVAFWAVCWIGRKGSGGTSKPAGKPSIRRTANGGNNASRLQAAAGDLEQWAQQFRRCEWTQDDWRDVVTKIADVSDCGVYCDPPWFGAGNSYLHSFAPQDHRDLAAALWRIENATVVVRYDDCEFIRDLYSAKTWRIIEAKSRTQANAKIGELWITNQNASNDT